ncbi:MAG TPA: ribosome maturation factor RimP [Solirubrobacterales bacterium]|nr:ribosome maturation factor RimP [Solirubrobacterales bacterium]HZK15129.1 ribosome maturation factor RimP [Solirubrobacterales bacterium]
MSEIEEQITESLNAYDPEIEVVAVTPAGKEALRLFIDHPGGVDLALCERVTRALSEYLEQYTLEVSSPGEARPLTKPDHFRRFEGRLAKVRTSEEIAGRTGFTGTIASASEETVELALPDGPVTIPIESIQRSNLVPEAA